MNQKPLIDRYEVNIALCGQHYGRLALAGYLYHQEDEAISALVVLRNRFPRSEGWELTLHGIPYSVTYPVNVPEHSEPKATLGTSRPDQFIGGSNEHGRPSEGDSL